MSRPGGPKRTGVDAVGARLERARDDLVGATVAAHRVDRDAGHAATERRCGAARPRGPCTCRRSGRAVRPLRLAALGQTLTCGALIACVARRLSRRDFEVFRFGTAMTGGQYSHAAPVAPRALP